MLSLLPMLLSRSAWKRHFYPPSGSGLGGNKPPNNPQQVPGATPRHRSYPPPLPQFASNGSPQPSMPAAAGPCSMPPGSGIPPSFSLGTFPPKKTPTAGEGWRWGIKAASRGAAGPRGEHPYLCAAAETDPAPREAERIPGTD